MESLRPRRRVLLALLPALALAFCSCMTAYRKSVGADQTQIFGRTYLTDLNTAWQSCLDALKASPLDVSNREAGYIQTKWTDNTEQKNFVDSFADADHIQEAKYRFRINVAKSFYNGAPSVKITVQKEQVVSNDVLEGFRYTETDTIEENTLLYRIGRLIYMKMKIARAEDEKVKKAMENTQF